MAAAKGMASTKRRISNLTDGDFKKRQKMIMMKIFWMAKVYILRHFYKWVVVEVKGLEQGARVEGLCDWQQPIAQTEADVGQIEVTHLFCFLSKYF